MNQTKLNYIVDLAFLIQFALVGYSGLLLLIDGHSVSYFWKFIHVKIGILSLVFFAIHLALHWSWLVSNTKKCFDINKKAKADEISEAKYTTVD